MFGSHLSIAGAMVNALTQADPLGLDTVQVFTKNQQQWQVKPLEAGVINDWVAGLTQRGWLDRTVSHASYLINLASCNDELWNKSVDLMTVEFERCETLRIPFLVHHPGSFVGSTLEAGISRIAAAYKELFKRTKGFNTIACLEGTAGPGSQIGGPFEHLASLREQIVEATGVPHRVAFCLDTCHLHAAGHDMSTRAAAQAAFDRFDAMCGISNVRVMHINDSKGKLGSKLDRHEHIGEGWVGGGATSHTGKGAFDEASFKQSGFAAVMNHPHLRGVPKILETPKGLTEKGVAFDLINLERLKSLMEGPSTGTKPRVAVSKTKGTVVREAVKPPPRTGRGVAAGGRKTKSPGPRRGK